MCSTVHMEEPHACSRRVAKCNIRAKYESNLKVCGIGAKCPSDKIVTSSSYVMWRGDRAGLR